MWLEQVAVKYRIDRYSCLFDTTSLGINVYRHGWQVDGRVQLKCDGICDSREGRWRGNWRMEWVASTLHTTSEAGVSNITTADAHTSMASSRLNWRPRLFKWTRPFRRKTKSSFCACAITFQTQSTNPSLETSGSVLCSGTAALLYWFFIDTVIPVINGKVNARVLKVCSTCGSNMAESYPWHALSFDISSGYYTFNKQCFWYLCDSPKTIEKVSKESSLFLRKWC